MSSLLTFPKSGVYANLMLLLILMALLLLGSPVLAEDAIVPTDEPTVCDAVCRYPADKLRENQEAIEAGQRAVAQWARSARPTLSRSLAELDRDIALMEAQQTRRAQLLTQPSMMFNCTSYPVGMFVNTTCY